MRSLTLLSLAAVAACSSSSKRDELDAPRPVETVRVMGSGQPGGTIAMGMVTDAPVSSTAMFIASVDAVWAVLPAVYESFAIPVTSRDNGTRTIGNPNLAARRRLGSTPMARFFDCGSTQGAPSADTYDMRLSIVSRVRMGDTGGSVLVTTVEGMGRPVAFSGEYVKCSSTLVLERRIADAVKAQLAR